jgi:transposase
MVLVCRRTGGSRAGAASGQSAGSEEAETGAEQDRQTGRPQAGDAPAGNVSEESHSRRHPALWIAKNAYAELFSGKAQVPGVGDILGATIHLEVGDGVRFPSPAHLAAYAGLVPTVHSSGAKTHYGPASPKANHYLKWAFLEAATAVARHLAESSWWIWKRKQAYRAPHAAAMS